MAADLILLLLQSLLVLAALEDVWRLRISNLFPAAILIAYPCWLLAVGIEADIWQNAVLFALVLTVGTFLFANGWLGGGDVKLLAATAVWFDLSGGLALLIYVSVGGGLIALMFIMLRRMMPAGFRDKSGWQGFKTRGPIPYGLAIAAGALLGIHLYGVNPGRADALTGFLKAAAY